MVDSQALPIATEIANKYEHVYPRAMQWKKLSSSMSASQESHFWHQEARLHGFAHCKHDWILFVDADEVLRDPATFLEWAKEACVSGKKSFKLSNYWYFMSQRRRAKQLEDSIVFCHREVLSFQCFRLPQGERENFYDHVASHLKERNITYKGQVMFDHYSWVRNKEAMLRKVASWGHRAQRDWKVLVEKAYEEDPLTTQDFVHAVGYEYDILPICSSSS